MKRCKLIFILIFWGILSFGQDTLVIYKNGETVISSGESKPAVSSKKERGETFYQQRNLDAGFKDNYKGKKFDYGRKTPEPQIKTLPPPLFSLPAGLMQALMYSLLGIIILVVIYFIFKNAGGFSFGSEKKKIRYDASEEKEDEDLENIENNNFRLLIQKAKSEEDFRKAVRYYYLWVLQKLTDKNLINWNKDKTDYDYFLELGQHPIKEDFSVNTYIYDYTWYGNFHLNPKEFELAESIFQRTLSKLN